LNKEHIYSKNPLNRGEVERRDEQWISNAAKDLDSLFLPVRDLTFPIQMSITPKLKWIDKSEIDNLGIGEPPVLLGIQNGIAMFTVDISKEFQAISAFEKHKDLNFLDARTVTEHVSIDESGIVAQARAQIDWHSRNKFCPACGKATEARRGGQTRHCPECSVEHHPRTDPVVIVVVSRDNMCLLGRSRGRGTNPTRYSALAGFVDQGESIEEAVAREVMEESGIRIDCVRYHSSQPWPFPSSLMIGCHAEAVSTEIYMDTEEMADVRWFSRNEVISALAEKNDNLQLPGPIAIAHHIIKAWAYNEVF